jgi:SAM-dependent methyltransferase
MTQTKELLRTEIIQHLINRYGYKSYLEIGVAKGENFEAIKCERKVGVDPDPNSKATVKQTSTDFFETNITGDAINGYSLIEKFDIVFIDGLHHAEQVYRDIEQALDVLNEGGIIVCHDMLPRTKRMQEIPQQQDEWTGDCWKAYMRLREREDLEMRVVDTDYGCGIISKGQQEPLRVDPLTYENFIHNRNRWMNVITPEDFFIIY